MYEFISWAFLLLAAVTFVVNRRGKARQKQQQKQPPRHVDPLEEAARPGRSARRVNSVGEEGRFDRSAQRVNSVGEEGRLDRSAQRVNSVGEEGRLDRSAQRVNSVGESRPRSRHQRMVEEQRAKAEAYRQRQFGPAASGGKKAASSSGGKQAAAAKPELCPHCGRSLRPGLNFCPGCGKPLPAAPAAAYSYSDGDRPPAEHSPAIPARTRPAPSFALPGFTGPELARSLVMAEILGPCKARQRR